MRSMKALAGILSFCLPWCSLAETMLSMNSSPSKGVSVYWVESIENTETLKVADQAHVSKAELVGKKYFRDPLPRDMEVSEDVETVVSRDRLVRKSSKALKPKSKFTLPKRNVRTKMEKTRVTRKMIKKKEYDRVPRIGFERKFMNNGR